MKNLLETAPATWKPEQREVFTAPVGIASRRVRRSAAKQNKQAFAPQYNYTAPLPHNEYKALKKSFAEWLQKQK